MFAEIEFFSLDLLANPLAGSSLLYYFHHERLCNLCVLFSKTPIESFSTISLLSEDMKFQILGIPKGSEFISRDRACLRPLFNWETQRDVTRALPQAQLFIAKSLQRSRFARSNQR